MSPPEKSSGSHCSLLVSVQKKPPRPREGSIDSVLLALTGKSPSSEIEGSLPASGEISGAPCVLPVGADSAQPSMVSVQSLPVIAAPPPSEKGKDPMRGDSSKPGPSRPHPSNKRQGDPPPSLQPQVSISESSHQFIHFYVFCQTTNKHLLITSVYVSNCSIERLALWDSIKRLAFSTGNLGWIVGDDFNEVRFSNEKNLLNRDSFLDILLPPPPGLVSHKKRGFLLLLAFAGKWWILFTLTQPATQRGEAQDPSTPSPPAPSAPPRQAPPTSSSTRPSHSSSPLPPSFPSSAKSSGSLSLDPIGDRRPQLRPLPPPQCLHVPHRPLPPRRILHRPLLFGGAILILPLCVPGVICAREWARRTITSSFCINGDASGFNVVYIDELELHKCLLSKADEEENRRWRRCC
ncbi:hypothetical protein QJS10_CPB20g01150 [Acorus calamus]|uniref:Uncharacterized protein n=1 Tax=Acorus calamus TaxID=4465 RepID=A0AAV9CDI5_ACOCL|nr:hypothetical protein QJS10_CPB20g01150 [Acorus calamus]